MSRSGRRKGIDLLSTRRIGYVDSQAFAREVELANKPIQFEIDEFVYTWGYRFFRFVKSPVDQFETLIKFSAAAIASTPSPEQPVLDWAKTAAVFPTNLDTFENVIAGCQCDCMHFDSETTSVPTWLRLDGQIIDSLELCDRTGPLIAIASHYVAQTKFSFFYVCINHES